MAPSNDLKPDIHGSLRYRFRIQRIGVEMEGLWAIKDERYVDKTTGQIVGKAMHIPHLKEDVSVRGFERDAYLDKKIPTQIYTGEVASSPMIRANLWDWMAKNHPHHVNHTCGLHVHMSLRHELDYQQLMDRAFHDHMLLGLHRWGLKHVDPKHCFWPRLRGTNLFCQDVFHADFQAQYKGNGYGAFHDNRYGIINYPWAQHKTVEVRVLPMFDDPKLSIRAVRRVLNLTEEFLDNKKLVRDVAQELKIVIPQYEAMPIRAVMDHNDPPALGKHLEHAVYYWSATLGFKPIPPAKYHHMLKVIFPQDDVSAHDPDNFVAKAPPKGFQPLDDPDAGIMYPMYYPWMRGAGPAYGCKDYELVRAFERMAPIGGWQTYPTPHEQSGIVGYAQELANQRKRDQHDQAQRMRRPIFKTVNLHPGE